MKTRIALTVIAFYLAGFLAGEHFNAWMHRPIVTSTVTVEMPDTDPGLNDSGSVSGGDMSCEFTAMLCWKTA